MKSNQELATEDTMVLVQDIVRFGGMQLLYSLEVRRGDPNNFFEIRISMGDETAMACAGESIDYALECYRRIVRGIVTPCTLEDVMCDFDSLRKKLRKNLYKKAFM